MDFEKLPLLSDITKQKIAEVTGWIETDLTQTIKGWLPLGEKQEAKRKESLEMLAEITKLTEEGEFYKAANKATELGFHELSITGMLRDEGQGNGENMRQMDYMRKKIPHLIWLLMELKN